MKLTTIRHFGWLGLPAALVFSQAVMAQTTWHLTVGTQFPDCTFVEGALLASGCQALQGMAFEPNEI